MKKIFIAVLVIVCASCTYIKAADFDSAFRNLRQTVDSISDINKLIQQNKITTPPTQTQGNGVYSNNVYETNDYNQKPPLESRTFFAGLKPDSSIIDVIDTFKKYDSVTTIRVVAGSSSFEDNNGNDANFKTAPIDKVSFEKYISQALPDGLYHTRYNQQLADYTAPIELSNGKQGRIYGQDIQIWVYINKMYIEGVPCNVEVKFVRSDAFYALHPDKVFVTSIKKVGYPYVIESMSFITPQFDGAVQEIANRNKQNIINKFVQRYGAGISNTAESYNNGYVSVGFNPFGISYHNFDYIDDLNARYQTFRVKSTEYKGKTLDSSNDI